MNLKKKSGMILERADFISSHFCKRFLKWWLLSYRCHWQLTNPETSLSNFNLINMPKFKSLHTCVFFTFLLVVMGDLQAMSRDYNHTIQGHVIDNISGQGLTAKVILMTADSAVIDTTTAELVDNPFTGGNIGSYYFNKVNQKGRYIVKAVMENYSDAYTDCELRSNREWAVFVKPIRMMKVFHELPEVLVKATKLKMVMQGDTIVYNANAFNLANGSMLDALIAKLPGAKLNKDGQIYVNGKYIESLLVNGHEFFSGNPKLALENLPAYTVNKIKVFNKAGAASVMMGRNMGDQSYVMDVRLKREYATGYMSNIETGMGTKDRYQVRGFGMKFSNKERIGAFVNINNLNDNQRAELNGEWKPQDMPDGLLATKTAGLSYLYFIKGTDWLSSDMTYTHTSSDNVTKQNAQTFLPGGDAYKNSYAKDLESRDLWKSNTELHLTQDGFFTSDYLNLSYQHTNGRGNMNTETLDSTSVINRLLTENSIESSEFNFKAKSENGLRVFVTDMWRLNLSAEYNRNTQKSFAMQDIQYLQGIPSRDYRNPYTNAPNQHLKLFGSTAYTFQFREKFIMPEYNYTYFYNKASNLFYRLDKLAGRDSSRFDILPSAVDALAGTLDGQNSYRYHEYRNQHEFSLNYKDLGHKFLKANIQLRMPIRIVNANLYYERMGRHDVMRKSVFFEPSLYIYHQSNKTEWSLTAESQSDLPDLTAMTDYRDDSEPLYIKEGNSDLKNIHRYSLEANTTFHGSHQRAFSLWTTWHKTDNSTAYQLTYDKSTGISTLRPMSVNGNWDAKGGMGYTRTLDNAQKFTTDNQLWINYYHNVDLATVSGLTTSQRSIVNNWKMGGESKLIFHANDNYEFTLHGGGNYYLINSQREGFSNIHAGDYNVGLNTTLTLPWNFQISTDMTMFARRGYQQAEMNTTDWVWNAQLTRSFIKGKLLAKLQGFDLLHELSSTQYAMNAQGRTEIWHNSIPRYVMLSLAWRFNINPQKK